MHQAILLVLTSFVMEATSFHRGPIKLNRFTKNARWTPQLSQELRRARELINNRVNISYIQNMHLSQCKTGKYVLVARTIPYFSNRSAYCAKPVWGSV